MLFGLLIYVFCLMISIWIILNQRRHLVDDDQQCTFIIYTFYFIIDIIVHIYLFYVSFDIFSVQSDTIKHKFYKDKQKKVIMWRKKYSKQSKFSF